MILLEFGAALERLGEFKYYLWKDHGIQAPDDGEVNNVVSFGFLVGLFFQELCKVPNLQLPVLAHFHEWMGGLGLMRIKHLNLPVATVFTTHATLLGRYLCTDNPDFYNKLPWINPDHAAGHDALKITDQAADLENESPWGVEPQTYALRVDLQISAVVAFR